MVSDGSEDGERTMGGMADLQGVWAWVCRVGRGTGCGGGGRLLAGLGETWWGMKLGGSESYIIIVVIVNLSLEASAATGFFSWVSVVESRKRFFPRSFILTVKPDFSRPPS